MPPEITAVSSSTAGLMALAGAPPGIAASAGPSPPEPLGASLFAVFLAQSSPPHLTAAAPKANTAQTPTASLKQTSLDTQVLPKLQALPKSKTMDTLPMLSFPPAPKAKAKASELPFPAAVVHQKAAEDQISTDGIPVPNAPSFVPAHASQNMPPPVLFTAPLLAMPAATAPVAAPEPASAAPLAQAAPERAVLVSPSRLNTPALAPPSAALPGQATSAQLVPAQTVPGQTGLPLPRTWAISALLQTAPQPAPIPAAPIPAAPIPAAPIPAAPIPAAVTPAAVTPAGAGQAPPDLKAVGLLAVKLMSATMPSATMPSATMPSATMPSAMAASIATTSAVRALPRVPSPVSLTSQALAAPLPSALQETIAGPMPLAAAQIVPAMTMTAATAALAVAAPQALEPLNLSPAKAAAKFLPAALKPATRNADTSTRTPPGQEPVASAKAGAPAAALEPIPEKHVEEQPSLTADSGMNNAPLLPQTAASDQTVKAEAKPLSAGDRAEVVRQAADGVRAMPVAVKPGAPEQISVQLHPKDWGSLQVSVSVAPSQNAGAAKTVTAHIVAETPQIKAALQSGTGALHQALRASGLHLEHLTVSVKTADVKAPEIKTLEVTPAGQSASAGVTSGQSRSGTSGTGYEQPASAGSGTNGFGSGFGTGGSQSNRQGQPPFIRPSPEPEGDDAPAASTLRPAAGRIDTHA